MTTNKGMRLEARLNQLIPAGDGPFELIAFELTHDGESWSVNTPFCIGSGLDRSELMSRLRSRWEIFKLNYMPKARVSELQDIGCDAGEVQLEVACTAFAEVRIDS